MKQRSQTVIGFLCKSSHSNQNTTISKWKLVLNTLNKDMTYADDTRDPYTEGERLKKFVISKEKANGVSSSFYIRNGFTQTVSYLKLAVTYHRDAYNLVYLLRARSDSLYRIHQLKNGGKVLSDSALSLCPSCNARIPITGETLHHILCDCPRYEEPRKKWISKMICRATNIVNRNVLGINTRAKSAVHSPLTSLLLGGCIDSPSPNIKIRLDGWLEPLDRASSGVAIDESNPNFSLPGFILIARFLKAVMKIRYPFVVKLLEPTSQGDRAVQLRTFIT
jgi:hypothetical protein